jgi:hypothetical protein
MNAYSSAPNSSGMTFAPMTKVAPLTPAGQFGPTLTAAQARAAALTPDQRAALQTKISATAKDYEAQFVGMMMGEMFNGVDLGGGQGAEAFKSVMMQAVGKKVASGHGIGLARQVEAEMLKLQGLS